MLKCNNALIRLTSYSYYFHENSTEIAFCAHCVCCVYVSRIMRRIDERMLWTGLGALHKIYIKFYFKCATAPSWNFSLMKCNWDSLFPEYTIKACMEIMQQDFLLTNKHRRQHQCSISALCCDAIDGSAWRSNFARSSVNLVLH